MESKLKEMKYLTYDEYVNKKFDRTPEPLAMGVYKGYIWIIISYGTHPCAYIATENPDSEIFMKNYDDIDFINVHGGLTYSKHGLSVFLPMLYWVIGWDYAHYGDYVPYSIGGKKWTTEEIYEHIKDAIDQIVYMEC